MRDSLSRLLACLMAVAICDGATNAMADEPIADIAVSYAFINAIGYGNDYPKGWLASGAMHVSNFLNVAGEVGGSYKSFEAVGSTPALAASIYNFMGGPRAVLRINPRLTPFAQVMFGGVRVGNNLGGYVTEFAWQPGGGVDIRVSERVAVRLQADYRFIPVSNATSPNDEIKQFRFASGVVLRTSHGSP